MSAVVLTLGNLTFQDFEVPEKIRMGGAQRLAVHELIGGGRVVDVLGAADGLISFSGIFSGSGATLRAQMLDGARNAGDILPLGLDGYFYNVLVEAAEIDYQKPWWIPFEVSCVVVDNPAAAPGATASTISVAINEDVASAASFAGQAGLSAPAALPGALLESQISIGQTINALGVGLAASGAVLNSAVDPETGAASLGGIVAVSARLAALAAMQAYVGRAVVNNVAMGVL